MSKKIQLFDSVKITRQAYADKYNQLTAEFNNSITRAKKDYKGLRLQEELNKLKVEYAESLEKERERAKEFVSQHIDEAKETEGAKVRVIPEAELNRLKALNDMPLSTAEISALIDQYGNKSYWSDKFLSLLAEKNGVDALFPADYQTKTDVIDELEGAIMSFIDNYCGDGDTKYTVLLAASDARIFELEKEYTSNHAYSKLSRTQIAERVRATILSQKDDVSRGMVLRNALRNADEKLKVSLLYRLSEEGISDDVVAIAGYKNEFKIFKENEVPNIRAAEKLYKEICEMESEADVGARLTIAEENKEITEQFIDVITDAVKENQILAKACADSKNPRIAEVATLGKGE